MLQIELSRVGTGILNLKCVVPPPGRNKEAIPLDATFKTNFLLDRVVDESVFHMNVFPVPPYPYKKNIPPLSASNIFSKISFVHL